MDMFFLTARFLFFNQITLFPFYAFKFRILVATPKEEEIN